MYMHMIHTHIYMHIYNERRKEGEGRWDRGGEERRGEKRRVERPVYPSEVHILCFTSFG